MSINCKVADLITSIPGRGDMFPRCREYLWNGEDPADIIIREDLIHPENWQGISEKDVVYIETGVQFYAKLLEHSGMMLHASAVELNGKAYLFTGPCGTGKSTHTRLWQNVFGNDAQVFNDDKPALRYIDKRWFAYGTPWCGKDGINQNKKVPLAGICFLKQSSENKIRRLENQEAVNLLIWQTLHRFNTSEKLDLMLTHVDRLVREIPVFELENRPDSEAALLSYETMRKSAEEIGL